MIIIVSHGGGGNYINKQYFVQFIFQMGQSGSEGNFLT